MMLEWEIDGRTGSFILHAGGHATLGRGADCTVVLDHPTVSRRHAEIVPRGGTFAIRNLSRTNLIFLEYGGQRARLGHGQEIELPVGARFYLGTVRLQANRGAPRLRLRCSGPCGKVVEVPRSGFCPNCGTALATADTFVG